MERFMKILITGTSTGFGKLITETLLEEGHQVAATMRNSQNKNKASALALTTAGATVIDLDVADDGSVALGVQDAIDALGGIDVVINNAGVSMIGLQETFTIDDWKKVFEINVFGVQRVNRAVLPLLREQGSGLLIHISSVVGRVNLPFFGPYTASKWALEALVEGYRAELPGFGIESILVEPGGFPTEIFDKMSTPSDKKRVRDYGKFANAPKKFFLKFARSLKN
ncbi:MAG: short-chain dehydrogenase, partial [Elusimicrobia bacterium]